MWIISCSILFFILAASFQELMFFYVGLSFCMIWIPLLAYIIKRNARLRRYFGIASLQKMNPLDFEEYILNLYNKIWYSLKDTPSVGDDGADGIGKDSKGNKMIIQIKRYADDNTIGSPQIRDFIGSMAFHGVKHGVFLTTSYFTKPAIQTTLELGWDLQIELVDKDGLLKLLNQIFHKK